MSNASKTSKTSKTSNSQKSSNVNSSMVCDQYFKTFNLIPNKKEPSGEWSKKRPNTHLWKNLNIDKLEDWDTPKSKGIPCGKRNNIVVIDLDFYDKYDKEGNLKKSFDFENNLFIKTFGNLEKCKEIFKDTLIVETARGGLHLYFQYEPTLKTTANEKLGIDIRSDGGYVVSMGTQINKSIYDGRLKGKSLEEKKGFYKVVNNRPIKKIPVELSVFLHNNMWRKRVITKPIKKNTNGKTEIVTTNAYEQDQIDLTAYNYDITDDELRKILDGLPDRYFTLNNDWVIFSTAMMTLDRREIWEEYSIKRGGNTYDKEKNNYTWDNKGFKYKTFLCIEHLLCNSTYIVGDIEDELERKKLATQYIAYYKYKPTDCHNIKPSTILSDRRYLDRNNDGDFFCKEFSMYGHRNMVVKSGTGTGKTTAFKNYITRTKKRFISIVSRVSLGKDQMRVFKDNKIHCYWHDDITHPNEEIMEEFYHASPDGEVHWYMFEGSNIVVTIDSIIKMVNWDNFEDYILYLDEFNSLVEYFIDCPNLDSKRIIVKKFLIKMLKECDRIIMTDADISDNSLLFLKQNDIEYSYIQNKYAHNIDKDNNVIEAHELYSYEELMDNLKKLKKFMVCCDSKLGAIKIHQDLVELGYDKKDMICITSDTIATDINLDDYPIVIFSPKIVYGVDSVMEREVFAFMKGHTIAPPAMVQQIARCRNIKKISFLFNGKNWKPYKYENIDECRDALLNGVENFKKQGFINCETDAKIESNFNELLINFEYTKDCYNTNFFAHFLNILKTRGYKLNYKHQKSTGMNNKISKEYKVEKINNFEEAINKCLEMKNEIKDDDELLRLYMPTAWEKHMRLLDVPIENAIEYSDILTCEREVSYHYNRIKYFINDFDYKTNLDKKQDYDIKKFTSQNNQIIFLKKFLNIIELDIDDPEFKMKKLVDGAQAEKLFTEYKHIYGRYRGKGNPFSFPKGCKSVAIKCYKDCFGKEIIVTKSTTKINPKTKKTEKVYKYSINEDLVEKSRTLMELSKVVEMVEDSSDDEE